MARRSRDSDYLSRLETESLGEAILVTLAVYAAEKCGGEERAKEVLNNYIKSLDSRIQEAKEKYKQK